MYDYEDDLKSQITSNIVKIAFPILLPLYILSNFIDWIILPNEALVFLIIRLSIIPIALICYFDLKLGWSRKWFAFPVWIFALLITLQLAYMAMRAGDPLSSVYLFNINLIAGLFIFFFTMRFHHNIVTLCIFYIPPALIGFLNHPWNELISPLTIISLGMFFIYTIAAKSVDRLRYSSYQQKTNLFFLATTDALSGLKLRRYFFNRFVQELSLSFRRECDAKMSVMIIDIDNFKQINDQYGHKVGDDLIKHIADILRNSIRVYDTACRFGGEEFIILLPDTRIEEAKIVSERIRDAVWKIPLMFANKEIRVSVSIGVTGVQQALPPNYREIQRGQNYKYLLIQQMLEIIKGADEAMYHAKDKGKNCVMVGEPVAVIDRIDESMMESLKGYLVYFDQDVFSLPTEDIEASFASGIEEINFYSEEYFFRRAVESMYRSYRDPQWQEMLVVMHIDCPDPKVIRKDIGKFFRLADTVCMFSPGRFGFIFFEVNSAELGKIVERLHQSLTKIFAGSDVKIHVAATPLKFDSQKGPAKKSRMFNYRDFSDRVSELMGILKRHRFPAGESIYIYPALPKTDNQAA